MVNVFSLDARTEFFDLVCSGMSILAAARCVGATHGTGRNWWAQSGQMMTVSMGPVGGLSDPAPSPEGPGGRALNLAERGMIQMGRRSGLSYARIGEAIGRNKSVVWREVNRNTGTDGEYYASVAHARAHQARRRPKPLKLVQDEALCRLIGVWMDDGWSPKLISAMLAFYFAGDQTMQVSHETIYQALYVQTRGSLRADLAEKLSLKRKQRVPHTADRHANSPYKEAFKISERPADAQERAVPGHWEGDLIIGSDGTAIGTLVERSTRFTILLHLPGNHTADTVAAAMIREMGQLPDHLRRSITWDRGSELAEYARIQTALDTTLYFCDPHSPWQRGSNENTNRLLRFWFEKGSDLSVHTPEDLRRVAAKLNRRPRPTLNLETPANRLNQLLQAAA
ncbi:Transposase and inactivated derivatives, IS30 family [Arthrobacter sp. ov407]|uniref:IS30 family transposase n=1 Tax=Arthrobacter sp. ov407 TaxID=1761748 RepID=UPI0008810100|nr:Transposase and inactivated derivatives, IS30 family [Arthrobacter sp. ov407]